MRTTSKYLIIVSIALSGLESLHAELPPGTYKRLKKEAEEVFLLRIKEIKQAKDYGPGMPGFICRAEIVGVERSAAGHKPGDVIRFQTYYVSQAARRNGFSGPQSPARLKAGWEGRVYLNPAIRGDQEFELAAYGRSLERLTLRQRPRTNNSTTPARRYLVVRVDSAPLKAGEGTVTYVSRGTSLTASKVQGSWFLVTHQGKLLWIHKKHVTQTDVAPSDQ